MHAEWPSNRARMTRAPEGSEQALSQAADWVKFADTKATILTAALGVVTTMVVANSATLVGAMFKGEVPTLIVGFAVLVCIGAFVLTLTNLLIAIYPRRARSIAMNRYSWPSLSGAEIELVLDHARATPAYEDALRQAVTLSGVADSKFSAVRRATIGFAIFLVAAVISVVLAVVVNAMG